MTRTTKIIIIVVALILLLVAYFFFFKKKTTTPPTNTLTTGPSDLVQDTSKVTTNDGFPLGVGSSGPNVRYLQQALNWIRPANNLTIDGDFGGQTRTALLLTVNTSLSALPMNKDNFTKILQMGNAAKQQKS